MSDRRRALRETVESLRCLKKGRTYRELATMLNYPKWFAATLSDIVRDKEGAITLERENELRKRLNLKPVRKRVVEPCPHCGIVHHVADCGGGRITVTTPNKRRRIEDYKRIVDVPSKMLGWAITNRRPYDPMGELDV